MGFTIKTESMYGSKKKTEKTEKIVKYEPLRQFCMIND